MTMHKFPMTADPVGSGERIDALAWFLAQLAEKTAKEASDVIADTHDVLVAESVELICQLAVLWHDQGIELRQIRAEMKRRAAMSGMARKLPEKNRGPRPPCRKKVADDPQGCRALYRDGDLIGPVSLSQLLRR